MLNKKHWVTLFILVVPVTLAELSLYILARDIFTWGGLLVGAAAELVSGVLFLMWKSPETESPPGPQSDPPVEQPQFAVDSGNGIMGKIQLLTTQQVGGVLIVLAVVAGLVTVLDTPLGWWRWYSGAEGIATSGSPSVITVLPTPTPTPVPTPASPLERRLLAAKSVRGTSAKDEAMRLVAKDAMEQDDYKIAIDAGMSSASGSGKSGTLKFVALCAAKRGKFTVAFEAAGHIPLASIHDSTMISILSMKDEQDNSDIRDHEQRVACD